MKRVLLIHCRQVPHYRVPIYNYLSTYLEGYGFQLAVAADGIQRDNPHPVEFRYVQVPLSVRSISQIVYRERIDVIIMFVDMRHRYLFPTYLIAKGLLGRKMIYWGQGRDLAEAEARIKNLAFAAEQALCDAIILYAEHLKKYVPRRFHKKIFVANNTLHVEYNGLPTEARRSVLARYGISTKKNIICVGRMQRRKRLDQLVAAHRHMNRRDVGLILAGPDAEGILDGIQGDNIYKVGPIFGKEKWDLMSAADVFCLPGAVGLSIVDAFHCGLPFVTEEGDESAEIMYLRNGENGFSVPRGNSAEMARRLVLLLDNDVLREQFSREARKEMSQNGNIEILASGFRDALLYVTGDARRIPGGMRLEGGQGMENRNE